MLLLSNSDENESFFSLWNRVASSHDVHTQRSIRVFTANQYQTYSQTSDVEVGTSMIDPQEDSLSHGKQREGFHMERRGSVSGIVDSKPDRKFVILDISSCVPGEPCIRHTTEKRADCTDFFYGVHQLTSLRREEKSLADAHPRRSWETALGCMHRSDVRKQT